MKHGKRDTKCCTWYFQRIDKWYFHGKGKDWVWKIGARLTPPVPQDYDGVMKGVRASYFDHMVERDFMGLKFYRPVKAASLLDYWYPNWAVPKEGVSSKEDMLLIIPKWKDRNSWIMKRR